MKARNFFWLALLSFHICSAQISIEDHETQDGNLDGVVIMKSKKPVDGVIYHSAEKTGEGFVRVITGKGLVGIYAPNGKMIIPADYTRIEYFSYPQLFIVEKKAADGTKLTGAVNESGLVILETKYHHINPESEGVDFGLLEISVNVTEGKRYGYCDYSGKIIVPPLYQSLQLKMIEGADKYKMKFVVGTLNNKQSLYDLGGRKLGSDCFSVGDALLGGSTLVTATCETILNDRKLMGFIDIISGKDSFACRFDNVNELYDNQFTLGYNGYLGLMKNGQMIVPLTHRFNYIDDLGSKAYVCGTMQDTLRVFLTDEKRFLDGIFTDAQAYESHLILTIHKTLQGKSYVNQVLYSVKSKAWEKDTFGCFTPWYGFSTLEKGGVWTIADRSGKRLNNLPGQWNRCEFISPNSILVTTHQQKYGLLDVQGKTLAEAVYEGMQPATSYFLVVKKDGLYGTLKPDGKTFLPVEYNQIEPIRYVSGNAGSFFVVKKGDNCGLMDEKGNMMLDLQYQEIASVFAINRVCVQKDGKFGVVDYTGKVIIPFDYSSVSSAEYEYKKALGGK